MPKVTNENAINVTQQMNLRKVNNSIIAMIKIPIDLDARWNERFAKFFSFQVETN